ncbi:MAG: D-alanine--D-alanine ligase [Desulfotomaculales bacterium]
MGVKIGVLLGGRSAEREVSLRTGEAIYRALINRGYDAVKIDAGPDLPQQLKEQGIELAFIALHGRYGEDGTVQGLLEVLGIPYTGSGVLASALAMNKIYTKKILLAEGLPTAPFVTVRRNSEPAERLARQVLESLPVPLVVKPAREGSTIGVTIVRGEDALPVALEEAFRYDQEVLVEKFIPGTEVTASVLGNRDPVALPLIEIVSATGFYDYRAKYTPGMSDHIIPPRLSEQVQQHVKDIAVRTYRALGCRGLARVDLMVDARGQPYVLEVNTIPGMTATSLFPDAARAAGIAFDELVERLVHLALEE